MHISLDDTKEEQKRGEDDKQHQMGEIIRMLINRSKSTSLLRLIPDHTHLFTAEKVSRRVVGGVGS